MGSPDFLTLKLFLGNLTPLAYGSLAEGELKPTILENHIMKPLLIILNLILLIILILLQSGCGGIDLPGIGSGSPPSEESRFLRESQDVRLQIGRTLLASDLDTLDLVDIPLPLEQYNRVSCQIGTETWNHCYTTSETCGAGSFPTACFDPKGGLKACKRGSDAILDDPFGTSCVSTTRDGRGLNGGPLEVIYCGSESPAGRQISGWVECD